MPKPLEIVYFGYHTDEVSILVVVLFFFKVYLFQLATYVFIIIWDLEQCIFKKCVSSLSCGEALFWFSSSRKL